MLKPYIHNLVDRVVWKIDQQSLKLVYEFYVLKCGIKSAEFKSILDHYECIQVYEQRIISDNKSDVTNDRYDIVDQIIVGDYPTMSLLRVPFDNSYHAMLIKDVSKITNIRICPHCKQYVFNIDNSHYSPDSFNLHAKNVRKQYIKLIKELTLTRSKNQIDLI